MSKNTVSKISNAFSTGGGGVNFEQKVQAMFLLSLLVDGFCPAMNEQTKSVWFQAKMRYDVDDLAVFTYRGQAEGKLLCQIKHSITISETNQTFQEVITAAWSDFQKDDFDRDNDRIALVTAQIAYKSQQALRFLHAQAEASGDEKQFADRVYHTNSSNDDNKKALAAIASCIEKANDGKPTDLELWKFCKCFILLLFDVDCKESINRALSISLIKCNSTEKADLVWSRLVEYAGCCNQTAANISLQNIDREILDLFSNQESIQSLPLPLEKVDLFIPMLALIGSWNEKNEFDRQIVEKISNMGYSEFESRARSMLCQNSEYLKLENGIWKVLHKEELLEQCKNMIFDDCVNRLLQAAQIVFSQRSQRVISQNPYYIETDGEYDNSKILRKSLAKSLCWIKKSLSELSRCNRNDIEDSIYELVRAILKDGDWIMWASLQDCLQNIAELLPDEFLKKIEWSTIYKPQEILRLFPKSGDSIMRPNYITHILWAIEALAWAPDYLIPAINALGLLAALPYEKTNWANTPINSIVSILLPWHPQTLADAEKRKNALRCLKNDNPSVFWKVLVKLLPNQTRTTSGNSKPEYLLLEIPEKIEITDAEVYEQYDFNLELAVEVSKNEIEKLAFLAKQITYMKESTLLEYLDCIDRNIEFANEKELFTLWLNLRKQIAQPNLKEGTVVYSQIDKIQSLIQSIEPKDIRVKYQKLYLENKYVPDEDFRTYWKTLEHKKAIAVKNIFDQFGAEETEKFGHEVKNMYDVAQKLGSSLNQGEISSVIDGYYAGQLSLQFYIPCVSAYVYNQGSEKLMETSLVQKDTKEILETLSKIPFSLDLYNVVKQLLPNETAYWEIATVPYAYNEDESEELELIVENFTKCKRYVDVVNIVGRSELGKLFTAQRVHDMLWLAGTEKSIGAEKVDDYAARKLIGWLQKQDDVALEIKCDIEFIYLPILDEYSEVRPHALNTRLSNDPDYFCSLIELFYKKHSEEKHPIELNEGMGERLCEILLEYKVTPGVDWNGKFHENVFRSWMVFVKAWSLENDRYEVAMQTVGSGFAYAELNDEKLPPKVIMEELNKAGNEELRRGYDIGIVNQRGVHTIDPEGKPEFKLAADYEMKAGLAEKKGYSRYAELLRGIAEQYRREASRNIRIARREVEE